MEMMMLMKRFEGFGCERLGWDWMGVFFSCNNEQRNKLGIQGGREERKRQE
jgi:hypothetical protein